MNIFLLQILSSSKNFDFYFLKYTTVPTTIDDHEIFFSYYSNFLLTYTATADCSQNKQLTFQNKQLTVREVNEIRL